jgi:citronellol/citronellal dehydrogenase
MSEVGVLRAGVLAGETCLVTGAGSGIGRAIAVRLSSLGASVVGVGRRLAPLQETAREISTFGGKFSCQACDVRDTAAVERLVEHVGRNDGLHILVNNAGGQFASRAEAISRRGWDAVIDLNLSSVFSMTRAAFPFLARRGGSVVNISLTPVERGAPGIAHSIAARAGVLGLTRTLALEWASHRIRLNCIAPGVVFTQGLSANYSREALEHLCSGIPLGRDTPANEVAELAAYLVSPAGAMITGQLLQIDGGASLAGGMNLLPDAAQVE